MRLGYLKGVALVAVTGLVFVAGPALTANATPNVPTKWKSGPTIPFGGGGATRFDGALYKPTKKVFFLGFMQADNTTSGEVWSYDVAAGTFADTGKAMPLAVSNYQIAALTDANGKLGFYIFGGRDNNGNIVTNVQIYYPATNTTATDSADPYPALSPSGCTPLPAMGVAAVGSKAYVLGGAAFTSSGCANDEQTDQVWRYNAKAAAGSRWKKMPSLMTARGYITPAVLGNKIYAIGGDLNEAGSLVAVDNVESWTVGSGSWNAETSLPEPCDESQAFAFSSGPLANTITLAGCGQWPAANADVNQYDTVAKTWSLSGSLVEARRNQAGVTLGKKMFILGGYASDGFTALASTEIGKSAVFGAPATRHATSAASRNATTN